MKPLEIYIYYRAKTGNAERIQAVVATMQAGLASEHGISAALKRKPREEKGFHTWMEVYLAIPADGFDGALARAVAQAELMKLIEGERHTEYFYAVSPCA